MLPKLFLLIIHRKAKFQHIKEENMQRRTLMQSIAALFGVSKAPQHIESFVGLKNIELLYGSYQGCWEDRLIILNAEDILAGVPITYVTTNSHGNKVSDQTCFAFLPANTPLLFLKPKSAQTKDGVTTTPRGWYYGKVKITRRYFDDEFRQGLSIALTKDSILLPNVSLAFVDDN